MFTRKNTYTAVFERIDKHGEKQTTKLTIKAEDREEATDLAWNHPDAPGDGTLTIRE